MTGLGKRTATAVLVLSTLVFSGCAPKTWTRADLKPGEGERAIAECRYEAEIYFVPMPPPDAPRFRHPPSPGAAIGAAVAVGLIHAVAETVRKQALFDRCMESRGFYLIQKPT